MICQRCKKTIRVVSKFLDEQLNNSLELAHLITNEVAKVIDNPLFQLLISQLPANVNNSHVLAVIEDVLSTVEKVSKCEGLTGIEKINCLMNALNLLPKDERNSVLLRLKSALTAAIDGNRFEKFVYDTAGQFDYLNEKIKQGANVLRDKEYLPAENVVAIAESVATEKQSEQEAGKSQSENLHAMPIAERPVEAAPIPRAF